jgi:predicted KAP-like P-loop ATPase
MFLNDQETEVDLLYYESIAKTVVKLVRANPEVPMTIGVHGDWGAGKSSVLRMTASALASEKHVLCIPFNGWTFEGFEDAKTVVMETIVDELRRARPAVGKVADLARKLFRRIDFFKLAKKAGTAALTYAAASPAGHVAGLMAAATALVANPKEHFSLAEVKAVVDSAGDYIKAEESKPDALAEHVHAFRKEFAELLEAASIDQLVVIVDDLDRCLPETAIATLEAIRLFLFVPRTAFIIGADEAMIEYAVRKHFPDMPPSSGPVSYARNYLEKLIQVPFRIPALGVSETTLYATLLLVQNAVGPEDDAFKALLEHAREQLRRPWQSQGIDRKAVEKAFSGGVPPGVSQALAISGQVTRILAEGTRGNPRQIKRFLNSMMLRHAIAQERGFGADIDRPILAKIMLAERFAPDFYEQVTRLAAAANGKPAALAAYEDHARAPKQAPTGGKASEKKAPAAVDSLPVEAQEWDKNEWVRSWVSINPALKDVDLRPYIFVTRDKRSYLGGLAAAGHLDALVERLLGPRMTVRACKAEIEKLVGNEPELVLDAISAHIFAADKFDTEPQGIQGIIAVVESHPALQRRLLRFMRELPVAKLGTWAGTSLNASFTDQGLAAEIAELHRVWATQTENETLRKAIDLAARVPKAR